MRIDWSPDAIDDLAQIHAYIAGDNIEAAQRITLEVAYAAALLADNSAAGKPGRLPGTREFIVAGTPFIIPYHVSGNALQILRVYHGARRWPERF